jgi:hypothetical protein
METTHYPNFHTDRALCGEATDEYSVHAPTCPTCLAELLAKAQAMAEETHQLAQLQMGTARLRTLHTLFTLQAERVCKLTQLLNAASA